MFIIRLLFPYLVFSSVLCEERTTRGNAFEIDQIMPEYFVYTNGCLIACKDEERKHKKKRRKSKKKHNNDELQIVNDSELNQVDHVSTMTSTVNIIEKNLICRSTLKI